MDDTRHVRLEYGIESYVVPEGTGRDLEATGGRDLIVIARVRPSKRAPAEESP